MFETVSSNGETSSKYRSHRFMHPEICYGQGHHSVHVMTPRRRMEGAEKHFNAHLSLALEVVNVLHHTPIASPGG
jgi:hypothetical protein